MLINRLKQKLHTASESRRRSEMVKMGLTPSEQTGALILTERIEHGTPAEQRDALFALRSLIESAELRSSPLK